MDRFKTALFAFFKDEILSSIGCNQSVQAIQCVCKEMQFTEISSQISLDEIYDQKYGIPASLIYEKLLDEARKTLFEEASKFIQIDEKSIIDPNVYPTRTIKLSLFVRIH